MGKPILNIMQFINSCQKNILKYMKNDNISYTEDELLKKLTDENYQIYFDKDKLDKLFSYKGFINDKIFENKKIEINEEMSL